MRSSRSPTTSRRRPSGDVVHGIWGHRSEAVVPAAAVRDRVWTADDAISGTFARVGSIALNAVLAAEARLGDRVAVFGQGVIGLLATRLAGLSGAEVVAVDTVPERLAAARAMGAAEVVTATVDGGAGAAIRAWSGGGVDSAIELSGNDRALHEAVRSVVVDGTVVASGFYQGGAEHLRLGEEFHHNRVRIVASQIARHAGRARPALGPAPAGAHLHGPGPPRPGRRPLAGHRRGRRRRRGGGLRAPGPRRPRDPAGRAAVPRGSGGPVEPRHRPALPRRPRRRRDPRLRDGRAVGPPAGVRAVRRRGHRRVEPARGDHRRRCWTRFPFVGRVYPTAEDLLADPAVRYVDIATGPEGRLAWIEAAVAAGKHVLAQKPLTLSADDLARLPAVLARAEAAGVRVAVNHNGRWAPPWRAATLLVRDGAIGQVVGVTHLHDKPLPPLAGTPFDDVPHMLLTDYLLHWVDITRTWLQDGGAGPVTSVQASDSRVPGQPAEARNPWSATLSHGDRLRRHGHPADRGQRGGLRARLPVLGARHHGHAAGQRAAGLRPARARRRLHPDRPCRCTAPGSSTASRPRWAS